MDVMTQWQGWMTLLIIGGAFYGATMLLKRSRMATSREGFLLGGRRIGWVRSAFSIAATWIWAPALFVAAQQGYEHGWVGVFWFTVPNAACLMIFAWFAHRARTRFPDGFTLSGIARSQYSRRVQVLYLIGLGSLATASFAVQVLAGAAVVTAITGIPFHLVALVLTILALSYTLRTGLVGSIITDWLQMWVIIVAGLGLSLWVAFSAGGSILTAGLAGFDGLYDSLWSGPGASVFWSFGLSTTIGLVAGPFGDQSFWQRAWAVEPGKVKRSFVLGGAVFTLVPLAMSLLGFAAAGGRLAVDDLQLTNLEAILHWLPGWTAIPFLLYVFSGLVSTMSSQLSSFSSLVGYDGSVGESDEKAVRLARLSMVVLAVLGFAIAIVPGLTVVRLFIFYGTIRACTLVPTVVLLIKRGPLPERGVFWGVLAALGAALPLSAWGNLASNVPMIVAGSLVAIGVPLAAIALDRLLDGRRRQAERRTLVS